MSDLFYFKASSRSQKKGARRPVVGIALFVLGLLSFYCVLFPAGSFGSWIKGGLAWTFGSGRFLFPLWLVYMGYRLGFARNAVQTVLRAMLWTTLLLCASSFFTLFGQAAFNQNQGGITGLLLVRGMDSLLGRAGSWFVTVLAGALTACGIASISPIELGQRVKDSLKEDLDEWRRAKDAPAPSAKRPSVVKPRAMNAPETEPLKPAFNTPAKPPTIKTPPPSTILNPASAKASADGKPAEPKTEKPVFPDKPVKGPAARKDSEGGSLLPLEAAVAAQAAPAQRSSETPSAAGGPEDRQPLPPRPYELPPLDLMHDAKSSHMITESEYLSKAKLLEQTLGNFEVTARVTDVNPGPVITRYDLEPAPGVKISSIVNLSDDIALAMKATRVRVLAPIPGKGAVGIEIPNSQSARVGLKEILASPVFADAKGPLTFAMGKTASGEPFAADLAPMPHLLVAGATGAGKSVFIHTMITSLLYRAHPDRVKFTMIDPKRLELPTYDGLPHIYDPRTDSDHAQVITQPKEAAKALARMVKVMEYRYERFAAANVRNIEGYNEKRLAEGLPPEYYIVVIIDELADLMLISARDVEDAIQRLAQMARAVGIHLVLATQRPSVDVITGVIKANLPARVAMRVASQTDSRVILDTVGAESLVGSGDMLFLPAGAPAPIRLQGAYVSEKDVEQVVKFCKKQGKPQYNDIFAAMAAANAANEDAETKQELDEALRLVMERKRVSQDLLKAHFGSSARATNVLSLLEVRGFIHKPEGTNRWEIYFDKIEDFFRSANPRAKEKADA